jgi:disulfide bond formation protein DsbB
MAQLYLTAATINVWLLALALIGGIADQLITGELPCPLCTMQRIAMMLCALGPLHILLHTQNGTLTARTAAVGNGIAILAALLGAIAAGRQILLQILPGDPGFGTPMLGLHLYTWGMIIFACQIAASGVMLVAAPLVDGTPVWWGTIARITAIAFAAIVLVNLVLIVAEAGLHWNLPGNPTEYLLFMK